jgi:ribonuclease R
MLPEKLSNGLCSLRPHTDRLTFSCFMEVTKNGAVAAYRISESVIHSKRRFTYEEVQDIIDGQSRDPMAGTVRLMFELSRTLIARRRAQGSLDFNVPEVKVRLDENGVPVEIKPRERLDSHRLVEEFMLLANQTVTEHVAVHLAGQKQRLPFIYRIHEAPDQEKMDDFKRYVRYLGHPLDPHKKVTGKLLNAYLSGLQGAPEENLITDLLLRSMMKAKYTTRNAGHFGLAFKNYTHFTSPIRRYPDLAVHRLLKLYNQADDTGRDQQKTAHLEHLAKQSSEREIIAAEAERESIKLKKVEYMQSHLGDEFDGIISGVVSFGIFVQIIDLFVEGLVHISDLDDDYYVHDEKHHQLLGSHTQRTYRLGDRVRVRVVRVDTDERVVDFALV